MLALSFELYACDRARARLILRPGFSLILSPGSALLEGNVQKLTCQPPWHWRAVLALFALVLLAGSAPAADCSKYHSYEELTSSLRELVKNHGDIARLVDIGKSRQGRSLWTVEIANPAGAPVDARPALLLAANFEGDQIIGSELSLCVIDFLLTGYSSNPEVRKRIDSQAFYIIPRVNPDAAEGMFGGVKAGRKANFSPRDDDNDGQIDEDGPEDLNGDGMIALMRVRDPAGPYMIHPEDPRLMKRADPSKGEKGGYAIYSEGIDNDGDGFINEDPAGGVDLNRNFQHKYPYYAPDAGPHMVSEPESRAIMEYVLKHRNIAAILTFGESDNLVNPVSRRGELAPPSTLDLPTFVQRSTAEARKVGIFQLGPSFPFGFFGFDDDMPRSGAQQRQESQGMRPPARRPAETVNTADIEYFRTISDKYRALTGIRGAPPTRAPSGAFFEYGHYQFGVPSFSTPGWGLPPASSSGQGDERPGATRPAEEPPGPAATPGPGATGGRSAAFQRRGAGMMAGRSAGSSEPSQPAGEATGTAAYDLRMLKWLDSEKIDGFIPWTPFQHPSLGQVEIGGFLPYITSNPPATKLADLGKSQSEFVLYLASLFPKVSFALTEVTNLGAGLFRIKAEIENSGYLATATAQGVLARAVKPTMVQLGIDPGDLVSGDAKTSFLQALAGSGGRQKYEWIIKGKAGATVPLKLVSQKGGSETATLTLK